jgi:hypothetical protein
MVEVQLRDEFGKVIPRGGAAINFDFPRISLLKYIDPYGDTVFNRLQMEDFLSAWAEAEPFASTPEQYEQWLRIRKLAVECKDSVHVFLTFIGD